jgi:hypothetical protein
MGKSHTEELATNEREYPNIVEVAVDGAESNRRMLLFHESRGIGPRHGRIINRNGHAYYRFCFPDLATARAFVEQFSGEVLSSRT